MKEMTEREDDDNLYTLPDDDSDIENSSDEESAYDWKNPQNDDPQEGEEDEEGEEEYEDEDGEEIIKKKGSSFGLLLKILTTPVEGWKKYRRRGFTPDRIATGCFMPMVILAALSEFADKIFGKYITLTECMLNALTTFISFFFGYFTVILLGSLVLPKKSRDIIKRNIGKGFVMISMASLALFYAAVNLFPMLDAVLVFLPIWTIYIIYKGVRFLRVPEEVETRTKVLLTFLILGCPFLWEWLISIFL